MTEPQDIPIIDCALVCETGSLSDAKRLSDQLNAAGYSTVLLPDNVVDPVAEMARARCSIYLETGEEGALTPARRLWQRAVPGVMLRMRLGERVNEPRLSPEEILVPDRTNPLPLLLEIATLIGPPGKPLRGMMNLRHEDSLYGNRLSLIVEMPDERWNSMRAAEARVMERWRVQPIEHVPDPAREAVRRARHFELAAIHQYFRAVEAAYQGKAAQQRAKEGASGHGIYYLGSKAYYYEGELRAGLPNGFGVSHDPGDRLWGGTFRDGKKNGLGAWISPYRDLMISRNKRGDPISMTAGEFMDGSQHGLGASISAKGYGAFLMTTRSRGPGFYVGCSHDGSLEGEIEMPGRETVQVRWSAKNEVVRAGTKRLSGWVSSYL